MASPFRPANELMVHYAAYHRDERNIATHVIGIPLIVFALGVFLARAQLDVGALHLGVAWLVWGAATLWYLTRGNLLLGLAVSLGSGALLALGAPFADTSVGLWLGVGLLAFFLGWALQFVGHYYEGRRPAFVDDAIGLLVGPMFIAGEALFAAGLCRALADEIVRRSGPTGLRDLAHPMA